MLTPGTRTTGFEVFGLTLGFAVVVVPDFRLTVGLTVAAFPFGLTVGFFGLIMCFLELTVGVGVVLLAALAGKDLGTAVIPEFPASVKSLR